MAARFRRDPSYRLHKQSGQGIVTLSNALGVRQDYLLGKYGTLESKAEYRRLLAEWDAKGRMLLCKRSEPDHPSSSDLTIDEVILAFWHHAETHYRHADGSPTSELNHFRLSLRPLRELYGHTLARNFGPLALKAVRQRMVESVSKATGLRWCRKSTNQRIERIKRMFKWAVSEELVPTDVLTGLLAVKGLQKGRSDARESEPVSPVNGADVEIILPSCAPKYPRRFACNC